MRLGILPIHLLRGHGIESADKTAFAALLAAGAIRFKTLRIHLLRQLGYDTADKTTAVRHRAGAV